MKSISILFPIYGKKDADIVIREYCKEIEKNARLELIVVADGMNKSEINELSKEIPKAKIIWENKRRGKGWAIRKGFSIAKNDIIGFVDVDESLKPKELLKELN